jgi:glycosyltransferase involved in cell wall biosynthesis
MRIVIDFQVISKTWQESQSARQQVELLCEIAKASAGHEVIVALKASDRDLIRDMRELLFEILPDDALRVWSAPGPVAWNTADNLERRKRAELIREAFLFSLEPDVVLVNGFFSGFDNDSVASISSLVSLPTVVLLNNESPQAGIQGKWWFGPRAIFHEAKALWRRKGTSQPIEAGQTYQDFLSEKHMQLQNAHRVFLVGDRPDPQNFLTVGQSSENITRLSTSDTSLAQIARSVIKECENLGGTTVHPDKEIVSPRKKLAYISPLPPEMSGIAEYSAQLIPELAQYYRITLIVHQEHVTLTDLDPSIEVHDVTWFRRNSGAFDHVLYHFGNSPLHDHMFELLRHVPGIVVLHDFFLFDGRPRYTASQRLDVILHGYGLQQLAEASRLGLVWPDPATLPGNLDVLQNATGVIVHSDQAFQLARHWYGPDATRDWHKIPLLRPSVHCTPSEKASARKKLGFAEDDLVICSFGHIVPNKLSHFILEALKQSSLSEESRCKLVLVGAVEETYEETLRMAAADFGAADFTITGWVEVDTYREYLLAADLAVQLRTNSRGETSASVLDCLSFGLPTIVNAHGTMRELDPGCVVLIADPVDQAELADALKSLADDVFRRENLGTRSQRMLEEQHDPRVCAQLYQKLIESAESPNRNAVFRLPERLADETLKRKDLVSLATAMAQNFPPHPRRKSLFLDVSVVAENDIHTGIQRVVRSILRALLLKPEIPYRIIPVRFTSDGEFITAYTYAQKLMNLSLGTEIHDEVIDVYRDDVFLILDLDFGCSDRKQPVLEGFQNNGARIWHVVYDLLPVKFPDYFPTGTPESFADWLSLVSVFDGAICISQAVANDLRDWLEKHPTGRKRIPEISWFHLGADIENSKPTMGLPPDAGQQLAQLEKRPTFLMVGTIEPRKGYALALDAFELLWENGVEANLAIVGKEGWRVKQLVRRLRNHSERDTRFFWFDNITDEFLERIYQSSQCLIAASEGEGFGLPLIEAAQHHLPILARDIPVFREVAGEHAAYFSGSEAGDLAEAVRDWLSAWKTNKAVASERMPWLTWEESAAHLLKVITSNGDSRPGKN